jgi:hypothetical protein
MAEPTIDELVVYVPAKDFEISQRFYKALGFTLTPAWGGTFDCRLDSGVFRLQDYLCQRLGRQLHDQDGRLQRRRMA